MNISAEKMLIRGKKTITVVGFKDTDSVDNLLFLRNSNLSPSDERRQEKK